MQLRLVLIGAALLIAVFADLLALRIVRLNTEVKFQQTATKLATDEYPPSVGRRLCSFASRKATRTWPVGTASCWITSGPLIAVCGISALLPKADISFAFKNVG